MHKEEEDRPEAGKLYKLTAGTGEKCILGGNTWKESEVTPEERAKLNPKH